MQVTSGSSQRRLIEHRVKVEGDLLLGQSCIDAICHPTLEPVDVEHPPATPPPKFHRQRWRGRHTVRALTQPPCFLLR